MSDNISTDEELSDLDSEEKIFDLWRDEELESFRIPVTDRLPADIHTSPLWNNLVVTGQGHWRASKKREDREEADELEANRTGYTKFKRGNNFNIATGDYPRSRQWYDVPVEQIDALHQVPRLSKEQIDNNNRPFKDNEYLLTKEDYKAVRRNLSKGKVEREFGKVFFGTETRYFPKYLPRGALLRSSPIRKLNTYIIYKDQVEEYRMYGNFSRPPRDIRKYKSENPSGILKELTETGRRDDYWRQRLEFVQENRTHPRLRQEIFTKIYRELLACNCDTRYWYLTTTSLIQPDIESVYNKKYQKLYQTVDLFVNARLDVLPFKKIRAVQAKRTILKAWKQLQRRRQASRTITTVWKNFCARRKAILAASSSSTEDISGSIKQSNTDTIK